MAAYCAAYARALVDVELARKLDPVLVEAHLAEFAHALRISPALREVLYNPSFQLEKRIAIVDRLAVRLHAGREVRNFIVVMLRNGRLHAFDEVLARFRAELARRKGTVEARVVSARPLDRNERQAIEEEAAKLAGTHVLASYAEDASLVGGVVLQIGSTVYDGSVRGRLERMKEQLIAG